MLMNAGVPDQKGGQDGLDNCLDLQQRLKQKTPLQNVWVWNT